MHFDQPWPGTKRWMQRSTTWREKHGFKGLMKSLYHHKQAPSLFFVISFFGMNYDDLPSRTALSVDLVWFWTNVPTEMCSEIFSLHISGSKRSLLSTFYPESLCEFCVTCMLSSDSINPLYWRHNKRNGVSNHQPNDCLLNRLFRRRSKKKIKAPRHWPLCGEFTGEFPAQRASNAEMFPFDDVIMSFSQTC